MRSIITLRWKGVGKPNSLEDIFIILWVQSGCRTLIIMPKNRPIKMSRKHDKVFKNTVVNVF